MRSVLSDLPHTVATANCRRDARESHIEVSERLQKQLNDSINEYREIRRTEIQNLRKL